MEIASTTPGAIAIQTWVHAIGIATFLFFYVFFNFATIFKHT